MIYRFGSFELDTDAYELRSGNAILPLEPKIYDLICFLIKNPGRLISRRELIDGVWDGRIVSDAAISTCIKAARKALGDSGNAQNYIRTVRGRGVQFAADIQADHTAGENGLPASRLDPVSREPSIAVLPLTNMSSEPELEHVADGIAEDLIAALSRMRGFHLIARNSTFTYKGKAVHVKQVGEDLGVRYVVEGSVRKAGNRLRVAVQLIDAEFDTHLWAESYDREVEDIFSLQDEITRLIAGAIEPELGEAEAERTRQKPPESFDAWDCYYRGMWHILKFTDEGFSEGLRFLRKSIEVDPSYARAHGAIAAALQVYVLRGQSPSPDLEVAEALKAGQRAVSLDRKDARNHVGLGRAYFQSGDVEASVAHFQLALEINPSFAWAHHGLVSSLTFLGQFEKAVDHADLALRYSPRDPMAWAFLVAKAHALYHLRRYDEAIEAATAATRQAETEFRCWTPLAAALAQSGRLAEAEEAVGEVLKRNGKVCLDYVRTAVPWKVIADREHYLDGLRRAGLPESAGD